ncbi:hypothetical protein ACEE23_10955 [Corynebacterium sp. 32222D000AT]
MSRKHPSPAPRPSLRTSTVIFGAAVISLIVAGLFGRVAELLTLFAFCLLAVAVRVGVAIAATMPWEEPVKKSRWIDAGIFLGLILGTLALFSLADHL